MDEVLRDYVSKYVQMVDEACRILLDYYGVRTKKELLGCIELTKEQFLTIGEMYYFFHGVGCRAHGEDFWVDWDFHGGEFRWCGLAPLESLVALL